MNHATTTKDVSHELDHRETRGSFISVPLILSFLLAVALVPAFHFARLPLAIDIPGMASAYWLGTTVRALFVAVVLALIGFPAELTWLPICRRYWSEKARIVVIAVFGLWMFWLFDFWLALTIVIDGIALAELLDRQPHEFATHLRAVFVPSFYLFCGVMLVFSYNHAIAGMKFVGAYDLFFNRLDVAMFRTTVPSIAHAALVSLPLWCFRILEFAYYSLYGQIGAAVAITALAGGQRYSIRYVGTLLTGYYIALFIFYLWPSIGPFSICPTHVADYPHSLPTYWTQETILVKARLLWAHNLLPDIRPVNLADYYIAFPCMHIALPLIAIWFLRRWRKIAITLLIFNVLLVASIVLLEWHYLVDLLAGPIVAWLAIWCDELGLRRSERAKIASHLNAAIEQFRLR